MNAGGGISSSGSGFGSGSGSGSGSGFGSGAGSSSSSGSGFFNSRGIIQSLPYARVQGDLVQSWKFGGEVACKSNYQQVGEECIGN